MVAAKWEKWTANPHSWLTDCCWTIDEARQGSIRRFPTKDEAPYIPVIVDRWMKYQILAVPKSRRMLMTWTFLSLHLWAALFHDRVAVFIQSKKAEDSEFLLGRERLLGVYDRLPPEYPWPRIARVIRGKKGYSQIYFSNGSYIFGIAEGPDQLRQYTASYIYCTEIAFWQRPRTTWRAMKPTLEGGGKVAIDSTAGPGFFEEICYGMEDW